MIIYIDNRGSERPLPLELYLDGELYDKLYLRKNKVNMIEFSETAKEIRFSFSGSYNTEGKVTRTILEESSGGFLGFANLGASQTVECSIDERKFVCPYDTLIRVENEESIILRVNAFEFPEVKGALYFRAFRGTDGTPMKTVLKKRESIGSDKGRGKRIVLNILLILYSIWMFLEAHSLFKAEEPRIYMGLLGYTGGVLLLGMGLFFLWRAITYDGTYKESSLKEMYVIDENDCWT